MSAPSNEDINSRDFTIEVEGLSKSFPTPEGPITAIDDISFAVESGEVVGVLGPNGAGKSTLIKSMLGLVIPDAGTVHIDGIDVRRNTDVAYRRVGAMLEGARNIYWRLTARENLVFFAGLGGEDPNDLAERHEKLLSRFDLADHADKPVNTLSRGMKQKVSLASTLARDVEVIFLDEPTLGLDVETSRELRTELNRLSEEEDVTVALSSHDMDVIQDVCDRVLILDRGSIITYEAVDELLELFQTQRYRLDVTGPVSDDTRDRLRRLVDPTFESGDDSVAIEFDLTDSDKLYDVIPVLEDADLSLNDVESLEPDLEDVFLEIAANDSGSSAALRSDAQDSQVEARTDD